MLNTSGCPRLYEPSDDSPVLRTAAPEVTPKVENMGGEWA